MRLAFVSPLPPAETGIADYAVDVLASLSERHAIDCFSEDGRADAERLPETCGVHPASDLSRRHSTRPYDVVIYQQGNGPAHDFLYDLLPRIPGLLVLHDLVLHHARARMFLESDAVRAYTAEPASAARRTGAEPVLQAYRDEIAYTYPQSAARLATVRLASAARLLPYAFPLFRLPVEAASVVGVHNTFMRAAIEAEVPEAKVVQIPMPVSPLPTSAGRVARLRARYGLDENDFVVGCFGLITPEKQIGVMARAIARLAESRPRLRLFLIGGAGSNSHLADLLRDAGIQDRAIVTGRVSHDQLGPHLALPDVFVHLRYPTARETSAALLRLLAQGCPVIMSDLAQNADVPDGAVVRLDPTDEEGGVARLLWTLERQPQRRRAIGEEARAHTIARHSPAVCRDAYERAIEAVRTAGPPPGRSWPPHWRH